MKISIISVYNNEEVLEKCLLSSLNKQKVDYELILIDNRLGKFKCAADALNFGGDKSTGDLLIFVHQDVKFFKNNLTEIIEYCKNIKNLGIAGVAGTDIDNGIVKSNGIHHIPPEDMAPLHIEHIESAQTLDEVLLIVSKKVFNRYKFDSETCDNWHLYGHDYSLQLLTHNYDVLILPIKIYHVSNGSSMSPDYYRTLKKILKKYETSFDFVHTSCIGSYSTKKIFKIDIIYILDKFHLINVAMSILRKETIITRILKRIF